MDGFGRLWIDNGAFKTIKTRILMNLKFDELPLRFFSVLLILTSNFEFILIFPKYLKHWISSRQV